MFVRVLQIILFCCRLLMYFKDYVYYKDKIKVNDVHLTVDFSKQV